MTRLSQSRRLGADLARGALFFGCAALHTRWRVEPEAARSIVRRRVERREQDFLDLARGSIYRYARSPYLRLLRSAGCEYGDLEKLVRQEELEGALGALYRRGVYLSVEEVKGKRPVQRGSLSFVLRLDDLRSGRWVVPALPGSRGGGVSPLYLEMFRDFSVNLSVQLAARGGLQWRHAAWDYPIFSRLHRVLRYRGAGCRSLRLFSQAPTGAALSARDLWLTRLTNWVSGPLGLAQPVRQHVPFEDPGPIIAWMRAVLDAGQTPHLTSIVSAAVSLCRRAEQMGVDLAGSQFSVISEALTPGRLAVIAGVGATAVPGYGTSESGGLALGCLAPSRSDDMHLCEDLHAVVQPGPDGASGALPEDAVLLSSLRPSWPLVLLNVSLGDRADLEQRDCGCPLEGVGWRRHLHTVRSFEKLKIGGHTMLSSNIVEILESRLPMQFGGGPTDYQLVEDEAPVDGTPRLRLLVHPEVGAVDEGALAEAFLNHLRAAGVQIDYVWRNIRWIGVERRAPLLSRGGKTLPIYSESWEKSRSSKLAAPGQSRG